MSFCFQHVPEIWVTLFSNESKDSVILLSWEWLFFFFEVGGGAISFSTADTKNLKLICDLCAFWNLHQCKTDVPMTRSLYEPVAAIARMQRIWPPCQSSLLQIRWLIIPLLHLIVHEMCLMHPGDKKVKDNTSLKLIFETNFQAAYQTTMGIFTGIHKEFSTF